MNWIQVVRGFAIFGALVGLSGCEVNSASFVNAADVQLAADSLNSHADAGSKFSISFVDGQKIPLGSKVEMHPSVLNGVITACRFNPDQLPAGLAYSQACVLSGIPSNSSDEGRDFHFEVVANSGKDVATVQIHFSIVAAPIIPPPPPPAPAALPNAPKPNDEFANLPPGARFIAHQSMHPVMLSNGGHVYFQNGQVILDLNKISLNAPLCNVYMQPSVADYTNWAGFVLPADQVMVLATARQEGDRYGGMAPFTRANEINGQWMETYLTFYLPKAIPWIHCEVPNPAGGNRHVLVKDFMQAAGNLMSIELPVLLPPAPLPSPTPAPSPKPSPSPLPSPSPAPLPSPTPSPSPSASPSSAPDSDGCPLKGRKLRLCILLM